MIMVKLNTASKVNTSIIQENKELDNIINKQIEYLYEEIIYPYDEIDNKRTRKFNLIDEKELVKKMTALIIQNALLLGILKQ
jgi:hypothetical protein